MLYLSAVLIITLCSLLHDGDYAPKWLCLSINILGIAFFNASWGGILAALVCTGIFWGVFRRGWIAKAELTAIRLGTPKSLDAIVKAYPIGCGFIPKYITIWVLRLPYERFYRRIQSGLIAVLWTGHLSSLPILIINLWGL